MAATAIVLLVVVVAFAVASIALVGHQLRSSLDSALRTRAQEVAELAVSAPAVLTSPGALESTASGRVVVVQVIDARGRILARSLALGAGLLPQDALVRRVLRTGSTGYEDIGVGGERLRMYAAPVAQAGGPAAGGAVLVASPTADIAATVHHLALVLALLGLALALAGAVSIAALTRRGLAPLAALVRSAEEIERTADPRTRLPEPTAGSRRPAAEIVGLTGVLNRMLASLAHSRAAERRFLADASHELRTPVTTLLGNVEFAARHGAGPEVLEDLRADASRLARLVDDLLALERERDDAGRALQPLALDRLVRLAVDETPNGAERVRLGQADAVEVRGEELALRRVIDNLVDNALVHGPAGGTVTVSVRRVQPWAELSVSDEGPGPDPQERELIFERFRRGRAAGARPGSGLGLSIVAAIAARHGGSVHVDDAAFTVKLPLAGGSLGEFS